jgi:hypothetical protein
VGARGLRWEGEASDGFLAGNENSIRACEMVLEADVEMARIIATAVDGEFRPALSHAPKTYRQ